MRRGITDKRREERKDFPEFFQKHIQLAQGTVCRECGEKLSGNVTEIAHILAKQYFKSISTEDKNVIYLCGLYSKNNCHYKFDNLSNEDVKKMNCFPEILRTFTELENILTEKINYKIYDRYTL